MDKTSLEFKSIFGRFTFRNLNLLSDEEQKKAFERLMRHYEKEENSGLLRSLSDYSIDISLHSALSIADLADLSRFFTKALEYGEDITYFELHGMLFFFCHSVTFTLKDLALGYFGIPYD